MSAPSARAACNSTVGHVPSGTELGVALRARFPLGHEAHFNRSRLPRREERRAARGTSVPLASRSDTRTHGQSAGQYLHRSCTIPERSVGPKGSIRRSQSTGHVLQHGNARPVHNLAQHAGAVRRPHSTVFVDNSVSYSNAYPATVPRLSTQHSNAVQPGFLLLLFRRSRLAARRNYAPCKLQANTGTHPGICHD